MAFPRWRRSVLSPEGAAPCSRWRKPPVTVFPTLPTPSPLWRGLGRGCRDTRTGKKDIRWSVVVKPFYDGGMPIVEIARRFNKSRQAVHNVLKGVTATYQL